MVKSPKKRSDGQELFLYRLRRHRMIVCAARILILILFLFLWEVCADYGIIDSFIFSSPSRIALCFWEMVLDRSIFLHIGITLYETIVSFLLVTVSGILIAVLLWCSRGLSEILEPYLVVLNSLPKSALAPLLIVWLGATPTTIIVAGNVCCRVRKHHEPVHQFYHSRQREDQTYLHPSREAAGTHCLKSYCQARSRRSSAT